VRVGDFRSDLLDFAVTLTALGLNNNWLPYTALALAITLTLAAGSWFLIEKPSLRLKDARLAVRPRLRLYREDRIPRTTQAA